jgi:hypothetical protein
VKPPDSRARAWPEKVNGRICFWHLLQIHLASFSWPSRSPLVASEGRCDGKRGTRDVRAANEAHVGRTSSPQPIHSPRTLILGATSLAAARPSPYRRLLQLFIASLSALLIAPSQTRVRITACTHPARLASRFSSSQVLHARSCFQHSVYLQGTTSRLYCIPLAIPARLPGSCCCALVACRWPLVPACRVPPWQNSR